MSQELIPKDESTEITYESLPPLLPQQALMLNYIIEGDNYTDAYRKAGYSSVEHAGKAAWFLISRNPLKAHLEYFRHEIAKVCTPDYLIGKLNSIADNSINKNERELYDPEIAIKAIQEINKMQGNYANTANTVINNVNGSIEDVRNARLEYKKEQ